MAMQKKTTEIYNFSNTIIREVFDTFGTLLFLIPFLKENHNEKFKNFNLVAFISLHVDFTSEEENLFYDTLNECKNLLPTPNIKDFHKMILKKGGSDKKFIIYRVEELLKAVTFEHKISSHLGLIAYKIYTKDKE